MIKKRGHTSNALGGRHKQLPLCLKANCLARLQAQAIIQNVNQRGCAYCKLLHASIKGRQIANAMSVLEACTAALNQMC